MRKILLTMLFFTLAVLAQEQSASENQSDLTSVLDENSETQNTVVQQATEPDENSAVEEADQSSSATSSAAELEFPKSVGTAQSTNGSQPASADGVFEDAASQKNAFPDSGTVADNQKKGGLLEGLYPVSPDEAIAKGRIYGGVSLSLLQGNTDEDALNILIGDVYDAYGYTFTVEGFGGYFIKDAMALGLRAGYSRTWFDIDFALMEDLLDLAEHRKYVSNGFFVQPLLKNYLKVLNSRNFYFFNETSISVEYSYGMSQTDDGEDMKKTRNRSWSIDVGINPGICIMVLNRFAFETSVGLLGLSSSVIEVEENNKTKSQFVYNIVNFTINLLALDFSLVYFF